MAYPKRNVNRRADNITFTPIATFGKMANNDTMVVINVSGINYNDINDINEVSDGSFQFMAKATNNGRAVFLVIKAERIDDFFNKTDDIKNKFIELNHYNNDEIDTFFLRIKEIISQTPTAKDKEKNKENINKTWKELLMTLKDPKVREQFLLLQTTPTFAKLFDETNLMLSKDNVRRILLADPQATFVTNISTWRHTFNREVIDTSQFVMIKRVDNNSIPSAVMDRLPEVKSQGGWKKLSKQYGHKYDSGVLYGLIKKARITNNLGEIFYDSKVYDVRNTRLIPGAEDKFLTVPGLVDNLRGEINQAAMELKKKEYEDRNETVPDFKEKTVGMTDKKLESFKNGLLKMCENKGITIADSGNVGDTILECAYHYAYKMSTQLNILKDDNKRQFAASLALVVAHSLGIDSNVMRNYLSYIPSVHNEETLNEISAKIHGVYMQIMSLKSDVNESVINEMKIMSINDIANFIKRLQKEKINESKSKVMNFFNRLENIK